MKKDCSYGAVVYDRRGDAVRYLLVRHKRGGHWGFPKGHRFAGEKPEQAAIREVLEETGCRVVLNDRFKRVVEYILSDGRQKRVSYWLATIAADEKIRHDPSEIEQVQWFDYHKAMRALSHDDSKSALLLSEWVILRSISRKHPILTCIRP